MKKLLALLLALMMLLSLAACGGEEETTSSRRNRKSTEATTEEITEEATEETEKVVERDYDSPYTEFESMDLTVIDDDYIELQLGELEDGDWGPICEVEVTNKTDKALSVYTVAAAVNDKMDNGGFYADVEPEDDASTELELDSTEKVKNITRLTMAVWLYDTEDYEFSEQYLIDIYPQGKAAHEYDKPDREGLETLIDEEELYISVTGYELEQEYYYISYTAINDSEELLSLGLNPVSINGFGCHEFGGGYILPDTYAEDRIWCMDYSDLCALGMEDITYLDMEIEVYEVESDKELLYEERTLYPDGKDKAEEFVFEYDDEDIVVCETEEMKLSLVERSTDEYDNCYV